MAQEAFNIAKEVLKNRKSLTDVQRYTILSKTSLAACSKAAQDLAHLQLANEEKEILVQLQDFSAAEDFIQRYTVEIENKQSRRKIWKKVYHFTQFVGPILDVFKQANFSPECSVALGLVGLLLIQPFNNKSEVEDRLEAEIDQLKGIISQVKFSKSTVSTADITEEVEGLSAAIIDFLSQALHYQKKWGIVKVLEGISSGVASRFQSLVDKIRGHAANIEQLAQREYTTILIGNTKTLDITMQGMHEIHARVVKHTVTFDIKIARIETRMATLQKSFSDHVQCEAVKYVSQLSAIFSVNLDDYGFDKTLIKQQQQESLAPKERWENNASSIQFPGWAKRDPRSILWIGGRQNKRGVSWVSSFALDLIEALDMERAIDTASVLCSVGRAEKIVTPLNVFKQIIIQLLMAQPEIVANPDNLKILSIQRFERAKNSPEATYVILTFILRMLDEVASRKNREIFLIIDRIDICLARETSDGRTRFLRSLKMLNIEFKTLRLILTSQKPTGDMKLLLGGEEQVTEVWIDTTEQVSIYGRGL